MYYSFSELCFNDPENEQKGIPLSIPLCCSLKLVSNGEARFLGESLYLFYKVVDNATV